MRSITRETRQGLLAVASVAGVAFQPSAVAVHAGVDARVVRLGASLAPADDANDVEVRLVHDVQRTARVSLKAENSSPFTSTAFPHRNSNLAGVLVAVLEASTKHVVCDAALAVARLAALGVRQDRNGHLLEVEGNIALFCTRNQTCSQGRRFGCKLHDSRFVAPHPVTMPWRRRHLSGEILIDNGLTKE